ncbi:FKBP-type peptidyl-prolyl cis-trans isomerase [Rothia sp. AR01]|uniref:peptidylprolyl isomerase n=1 Tax=Rothia santali TaxID=2949643 RepID=A0A9X2HCH3_9MICC|nr:FKBP-type peptidyl-prolyl cis-trans isomerase [Rothia santali]MCP3424564.1 FKBP-type peptidyl-prolyl cis-trans isomerase [Rothia santali]
MRNSLKLSAAAVALTLLLAGCGGGGDLDSIDYEDQGEGRAPSISFETPLTVDEPQTRVLKEGDGADIEEGDTVEVNASLFNAEDQSSLGDSYSQQPITITVDDTLKDQLPEIHDLLLDNKVGVTFAYAQPASDDAASQGADGAGQDGGAGGAVEVYSVDGKILSEAEGTEVTPPEDLPKVSLTDGDPEITIPEGQDEPTELVAQDLIEGDGEEVGPQDGVFVHYAGVRWEDGEQFDAQWTGQPASLSLDQVIPGWSEGLAGKKVGSRVLLEIPAEKAYGTAEELGEDAQQPAGALVFVVDILGRTDPVETPAPNASGQAPQDENHQSATPEESGADQ